VLRTVLAQTNFGHVWMLRFALILLLLSGLLPRARATGERPALSVVGAVAAALLLVDLAWASHAVGAEKSVRPLHLAVDALHLLGAGLWLGALVPLVFVLRRARGERAEWMAVAATATRRFSRLGMVAVAALLLTGLVNAWLLVGSVAALFASAYGQLVAAKLVLFAVIILIACFNRLWLAPRLDGSGRGGATAVDRLARNATVELVLGAIIIAIVGLLGTLPPSAHRHELQMHDEMK
jgi:copper resistance protein D